MQSSNFHQVSIIRNLLPLTPPPPPLLQPPPSTSPSTSACEVGLWDGSYICISVYVSFLYPAHAYHKKQIGFSNQLFMQPFYIGYPSSLRSEIHIISKRPTAFSISRTNVCVSALEVSSNSLLHTSAIVRPTTKVFSTVSVNAKTVTGPNLITKKRY